MRVLHDFLSLLPPRCQNTQLLVAVRVSKLHNPADRNSGVVLRESIPTHRRDQFLFGHAAWVTGVQRHEGYVWSALFGLVEVEPPFHVLDQRDLLLTYRSNKFASLLHIH